MNAISSRGRHVNILCAGAGALAACALLYQRNASSRRVRSKKVSTHIHAARTFNRSSALLALSVFADSAIEHYRGAFSNPAMITPLVTSALSMSAGVHGGRDLTPHSHNVRHVIYVGSALAGIAGTAFHVYNVTKRPGAWTWNNLFYGAPVGAPMALLLSGVLGLTAEQLRDQPWRAPRLLHMKAGTALGLVSVLGLLGTTAEVALLHFRGSFQHRAMYAPVTLPPAAAFLLAKSLANRKGSATSTRWALRATALLGVIGVFFHTRGIARNHGGWRNWSQNIPNGPPLPAPPSFTALALAGLAALRMREVEL